MQWIDINTGRVVYDELENQVMVFDAPSLGIIPPTYPPTFEAGKFKLYSRQDSVGGWYGLWGIDGNGSVHDLLASGSGVVEAVKVMKIPVVGSTVSSTASVPASAEIIEVLVRINGAYAAGQTISITHDGNTIVPTTEINAQTPNVYTIKTLHLTSNPSIITVIVTGVSPGGASCDVIVKFATNFLT